MKAVQRLMAESVISSWLWLLVKVDNFVAALLKMRRLSDECVHNMFTIHVLRTILEVLSKPHYLNHYLSDCLTVSFCELSNGCQMSNSYP